MNAVARYDATPQPLRFISLFAGIGGFDLGFERAGMECVAQVEWDASAGAVLAARFPSVKRFEDVRDVGRRNLPAADVICGGFPCQDVSVAGRRAGLAGERSGLWFEFLRILTELTPQWCVIENVPGLLSSNGGRDFAVVLRGLVECGYGVAYRVLDAQYFGVAQRRRRVFIVGSLGSGRCAEVLFEREGSTGNIEPSSKAREGVAASPIVGTLSSSGAGTARTGNARSEADMLVIEAIDARNSRSNGAISGTLQSKNSGSYSLNYINPIVFQQNQREEVRELGGVVGSLAAEPGAHQQNYIAFMAGQGAKAGGIAASETTSPTLKAGASGTNQAPTVASVAGVRRLTPIECSRLQGFPDDWLEGYDADEKEAHAREVLHGLWREAGAEARTGRRSGVALSLLTEEILLAGVYGGWLSWEVAARCATARGKIPRSDAWSENFVRLLWQHAEHRPSPYRRESFEQLAGELGRSVQELPLEDAQARAFVQRSGVWTEASTKWTLRPPLAATEARRNAQLSDSARYARLGNAVCVNVAEWIGKRIVEAV